MAELRLEVREFSGLTRWQWVLTDAAGSFQADHEVRLDARDWEFEAFADLRLYVSWHAAPDRYREDEARIVAGVGAWAGAEVLGPSVADALVRTARRGPVTVRVIVPPEARGLLFRPLELAHVHGRPLARQDVTLVMQAGSTGEPVPAGDRLRVLGLFSLPEGGQPLNLRRERHDLVRLVNRIAAAGRAADIQVLQYGVTRDRLRDVLEEAEGWDVIHVSGHGTPGQLLLETAAGGPDRVTAGELADMLDLARGRMRLITVSACWSAAAATADQRRFLGLPVSPERSTERPSGDSPSPGALATEIAERLGCAVLAMRFPVSDEFAIALSGELYRLLAEEGQSLPRAVGMTLRELRRNEYPALSVAAPALFGETAIDLTLAAPPRRQRDDDHEPRSLKMTGFPPQPERFVGRTGVMARASAALAAESGIPGVLLHGMPGGGKTACALELAYTHEHAFDRLAWFKAPDEGMATDGALTDFALALERYLDGFQMAHLVADSGQLAGFLPQLTELMRQPRLLLVIDNSESLLTETGQWRDDRWGQVITALIARTGLGRLILTSRRVPAGVTGLRVEAVDALSASEGLLLARELPNLRRLIRRELPGIEPETARQLACGVLAVTQGHPKLLELADGQAADPERLASLVESGDQAWREQGGLPDGLFATGETTADPGGYLHVLAAWTRAVTNTLTPGERDLFWFLCCLEEPDRELSVLEANWGAIWSRLGRGGRPADLHHALAIVTARGLAAHDDGTRSCTVHPGVAATGRVHAGKPFQDAVDTEAAAFWMQVALHQADGGEADTGLMVRAGLAAVPYLIRQQRPKEAADFLEHAFLLDPSRANATAILPAIQQLTDHDPAHAGVLGRVLQAIDPAAAETQLRAALDAAASSGDYRGASAIAGRLSNLCRSAGRLGEALEFVERANEYTRQGGLGPWSQLLGESARLKVLNRMGHAGQVLREVRRLIIGMRELPDSRGPGENADPWHVRESLLGDGRDAALLVRRCDDALAFNAEVISSMRSRRAPDTMIARVGFNDYHALISLGRVDEACDLLLDCRRVFRDANDIKGLGLTLSALAQIEDKRGHGDVAIRLVHDALRYHFLAEDVTTIADSYLHLGNYLQRHARQPVPALASHLAAALVYTLTGDRNTDMWAAVVSIDLLAFGPDALPPENLADLVRHIGEIPGTDLAGLIARLSPDAETAERTLRALTARAAEMASQVAAEE